VNEPDWRAFARMALEEDRAHNDVTTDLLGDDASRRVTGRFIAEGEFVVVGLPMIRAVFAELGDVDVTTGRCVEGDWVEAGDVIATAVGAARNLLGGERVALNYLQRLSGIATETRQALQYVAGFETAIVDTRKTTPGLRALEKYAVRVAGGVNHRFSLEDAVLWKDNHWALLAASGRKLVDVLASAPGNVPVQVEVEREDQLRVVIDAGVRFVLLDNQSPETIARWARALGPNVTIEASGGITAENARAYAEAGVHRISMGTLTHSVAAVPITFAVDV